MLTGMLHDSAGSIVCVIQNDRVSNLRYERPTTETTPPRPSILLGHQPSEYHLAWVIEIDMI